VNMPADNGNNGHGAAKIATLSSDDVRERLWAYEDFASTEEPQTFNISNSFVSLGFLRAAVRRTRRLWLACAAVGILAGLAFYAKYPVSYAATVSVLIKPDATEDAVAAMQTQIQLVESQSVAGATVTALGLDESVTSFRAAYTAAATTDEVITITLHAPTATGAVDRANTLAVQYLNFRASLLRSQQTQDVAAYQQQVTDAEQQIATLKQQVSQLQGAPGSQPELTRLQNQLTDATSTLPTLQQTVTGLIATEKSTVSGMINGGQVLDNATAGHHSATKDVIEYVLIGLILGLVAGLVFVIIRETVSDRLRRRDDIAATLGAPVRLSTGPLHAGRLPLAGPSAASRDHALRQVTSYLHNVARRSGGDPATLAVVALGNAAEIAPAVAAVARRCQAEGLLPAVADLVKDAPVAKLLGVRQAGPQLVHIGEDAVVVITPPDADQVTSGPLSPARGAASAIVEPPAEAVTAATENAGLLLTVTELDPAVGADNLTTWATRAVVVVTAGRTSATQIYAAGEMLRLAGIGQVTAIVVGSDETDKSLGSLPEEAPLVITPDGGKPGDLL
jgi:capsular polysaccharide biosynthesis protein